MKAVELLAVFDGADVPAAFRLMNTHALPLARLMAAVAAYRDAVVPLARPSALWDEVLAALRACEEVK